MSGLPPSQSKELEQVHNITNVAFLSITFWGQKHIREILQMRNYDFVKKVETAVSGKRRLILHVFSRRLI